MKERLEQIKTEAMEVLKGLNSLEQLEEFRVKVLGKKVN